LPAWREVNRVRAADGALSQPAREVLTVLKGHGASFFEEIVQRTGLLPAQVEEALAELVGQGRVTSDSFTGLRALLVEAKYRGRTPNRRPRLRFRMEQAGRWSLLNGLDEGDPPDRLDFALLETVARGLLRRYGVVFRKLVDREAFAPPWRELVRVYRTLEARGEIRGGRFVDGVWGEQFALPDAVTQLRAVRKQAKEGTLVSISAADPLNLTGVLTPGRRVAGLFGNRVLYRDGVPVAVKEGRELAFLEEVDDETRWAWQNALVRRPISPKLRAYLGKGVA